MVWLWSTLPWIRSSVRLCLAGRFFSDTQGRRRQKITRRTVGFAALFCFLCAFGSLPLFCTASSGFAEIHTRISPLDRGLALCRGGFCMAKQRLFATGKTSDIKKEPIGFLLCFYCARPGRLCGAFPFVLSRCLPSYEKTTSARFCPANARIRPTAMRPTLKQSHARIDLLGNRPCANCFLRCLLPHGEILSARALPAAKPYPFYNRPFPVLCLCRARRASAVCRLLFTDSAFAKPARLQAACRLRLLFYIAPWPAVLRDKK